MPSFVQIHTGEPSAADAADKEHFLFAKLASFNSLLVALSGGTDSAYLAWAAHQVLGDRALSVTAISPSYSSYDREQLEIFLRETGIRTRICSNQRNGQSGIPCQQFRSLLFLQRRTLFSAGWHCGEAVGSKRTAYGVNADDTFDFRPGHRAAAEHKVLTPLLDAQLHKAEIRFLSERAKLPSWDRPASACLSSRLPYGTEVTPGASFAGRARRTCPSGPWFSPISRKAARQASPH